MRWFDYPDYPEYPQLHPPFEHRVTVLDLILNTGPAARRSTCAPGREREPAMRRERLVGPVERYYSGKVEEHGPSPGGVDWNSVESQELRFEQLLTLHRGEGRSP